MRQPPCFFMLHIFVIISNNTLKRGVDMKQRSIWQGTVNQRAKASFSGGKSYDAVIIGAGMCGVLTALKLKEAGINAAVLEAETIGSADNH